MQLRHFLVISLVLLVAGSMSAAKQRAKKQPKPTPEQLMAQAAEDFEAYRFDAVLQGLAELDTPEALDLRRRAELGANMLGRVEQVAIIDSVSLPRSGVLALLPLQQESGALFSPTQSMLGQACVSGSGAFVAANGKSFIWSMPAADGSSHLVKSYRLVDGSLEPAEDLGEELHIGERVDYPFLMPDGVTLYFAATGAGSLGGLDIFMSRSDGSDFLQPQNLGMPYNSPYDDYMMAIDESTGYGFWLTDRNQIPDSVTLYMFRVNDLRRNYPADDETVLADYARITSVGATPGCADPAFMKAYTKPVRNSQGGRGDSRSAAYAIAVPGRGVITSSSQVRTQIGLDALGRYLGVKQQLDTAVAELERLRSAYRDGDRSVSERILTLESELPALEKQLINAANAVIKAESSSTDR